MDSVAFVYSFRTREGMTAEGASSFGLSPFTGIIILLCIGGFYLLKFLFRSKHKKYQHFPQGVKVSQQPKARPSIHSPAAYRDPFLGLVLNGYRLEMKLGEGGMGKVYLARHELIDKRACVKICESSGIDAVDERFLREAKILAQLDHPNLITAFDFGQFEGGQFILMPYVKGMSLADFLKQRGILSVDEVGELALQVAAALHVAHEANIVHRDIKPGNLLIEANGKVWLSDFGISHITGQLTHAGLTQTGEALGSPSYISPEQIENRSVDCRADIYAFGATLYHLLCGEPPYRAENPLSVLRMHIEGELVFPEEIERDCGPELIGLIKSMMSKNPSERPQTMLEFSERLSGALTLRGYSSTGSVRFTEETLQQIIRRSHEIEERERQGSDKIKARYYETPVPREMEYSTAGRYTNFERNSYKSTNIKHVLFWGGLALVIFLTLVLGLFRSVQISHGVPAKHSNTNRTGHP